MGFFSLYKEHSKEMSLYSQVALDIKSRLKSVEKILALEPDFVNIQHEIEFMCLQMRGVLELIVLGSLVTNATYYNKTEDELKKMWRINRIMEALDTINPNFFPEPVLVIKEENSTGFDLKPKENGNFLQRSEIEGIYNQLSDFTHPKNPYASNRDFSQMKQNIVDWWYKIMSLLDSYLIHLVNLNVKFLVLFNIPDKEAPQILFLINSL
jgi:hypothetical protein